MSRNTAAHNFLTAHKRARELGDVNHHVPSENGDLHPAKARKNRELGIRTTNNQVVAAVATVPGDDDAGATPFS